MNKRSHETALHEPGECGVTAVDQAAVDRVRDALSEERIAPQAALFAALGDQTRLTLLTALAEEPLCVCDLAALTDVTPSCVSHQLRVLRELDLVSYDRVGKRAVYRLSDSHVATLLRQAREHVAEGPEDRWRP